jgi:uncharacterized protein
MILALKAKPNNRENRITRENDVIVVRIHAPAQDGKANKAIVEFLAEIIDIPKSSIEVIAGFTSSHKRIAIAEVYDEKVKKFLAGL